MRQLVNENTQPLNRQPVFQNWKVIANGWYFVCASSDLGSEKAMSARICGHQLALYRGVDGKVRAMDAFCPHMGTDLGIGKVVGNQLRCFFHHWCLNEKGQVSHTPSGHTPSERIKNQTYAAQEKYGFIWVNPMSTPDFDVVEIPLLKDNEVFFKIGTAYVRTCHHHVTMINGLDMEHLRTVHNLQLDMSLSAERKSQSLFEIKISGKIPPQPLFNKIVRRIMGENYGYTMRYSGGTIGALSILQDVKLFGRFNLPELHMIFAYRPMPGKKTLVQPIYLTKKYSGITSFLKQAILIWLTKRAFFALQGEDGVIYDNMRFNPNGLTPNDKPVIEYIKYINSLEPSIWSKLKSKQKPPLSIKKSSQHEDLHFTQ